MSTLIAPIERYRTFDRFNKLAHELFENTGGLTSLVPWAPLVDVKQTPKETTFLIDLPGLEEKDVEIEIDRDVLTISGRREMRKDERREDFVRLERSYGSFQRSFTLESAVKPELVKAQFKDGLLTVTVPRVPALEPKKVPIKNG
jgi:HSP20 family protein